MFGSNSAAAKWIWLMGLLILANIANYLYSNWGLVTVKVTDAPLSKIIRSIEWQGWVTIYTNLPPDTKVTMYADHVPLAEAMEILAANVDVPPSADGDDDARPRRDRSTPTGDQPGGGGFFGSSPAGGGPVAGGTPGQPRGEGGGGGFGRRAQWNLAFFVAPTTDQVKQEIRQFQSSDPDDSLKVYAYGTQMQMIASESTSITADPRLQSWPGVKPVDQTANPPDASASDAADSTTAGDPAAPPAPTPPTVQTYLQAFAQAANIWIMAPGSWTPEVSSAPPPNPSIIRAVENFVSGSHGAVIQALVLRAGRGGARSEARTEVAGDDDAWADRMRNAINGLPPDERPDALEHLKTELQFRKEIRALPPEQRRQKFFQHMAERMIYGERLSRLSPEKRAKVYQRMIGLRAAAKAQK